MIRSLRGTLVAAGPEGALVEVGGVGLLVHVSAHTLDALPAAGAAVRLQTHLVVREDALDLYGFADAAERTLFEALVTVTGVGPRMALSLCGIDRPEAVCRAIAAGDARRLQAAPGVGRRTAERLVLELRDRLGVLGAGDPRAGAAAPAPAGPAAEAHQAMLALGYAPDEAARALAGAPPDLDAAGLVRHGLARMRGA